MASLAESGASVVKLSEVCTTPGSVVFTFDDAFGNSVELCEAFARKISLPSHRVRGEWLLRAQQRLGNAAARYSEIAVDELGRYSLATGRTDSSWAHTVSHPDLTRLARHQVETELCQCKRQIEDHIGGPVEAFAYPYGTCSAEIRAIACREFRAACGTRMGFAGGASDRWELPRIDAYYLRSGFQPPDLLTSSGRFYVHARVALRKVRSLLAR